MNILEHPIYKEIVKLIEDRNRLDWLESKGDGSLWVARESFCGRGYRLHNTGKDSCDMARATVRDAIDAAMKTL